MSRKLQNGDIRQYSIKPKKTIEIIDLDENENDENNQEEHEHDNENKEFENEINGEIENTNDNKVVDVSSDEFDSEKNKQQTKKIQKKSNKHSIEKFVYRLEIINNASENLNPTTDGNVTNPPRRTQPIGQPQSFVSSLMKQQLGIRFDKRSQLMFDSLKFAHFRQYFITQTYDPAQAILSRGAPYSNNIQFNSDGNTLAISNSEGFLSFYSTKILLDTLTLNSNWNNSKYSSLLALQKKEKEFMDLESDEENEIVESEEKEKENFRSRIILRSENKDKSKQSLSPKSNNNNNNNNVTKNNKQKEIEFEYEPQKLSSSFCRKSFTFPGSVECMKWNPTKSSELICCFSTRKEPCILDVETLVGPKPLENPYNSGGLLDMCFNTSNGLRLFVASRSASICSWDLKRSNKAQKQIIHGGSPCNALCVSEDGRLLYGGTDLDNILVWDLRNMDTLLQKFSLSAMFQNLSSTVLPLHPSYIPFFNNTKSHAISSMCLNGNNSLSFQLKNTDVVGYLDLIDKSISVLHLPPADDMSFSRRKLTCSDGWTFFGSSQASELYASAQTSKHRQPDVYLRYLQPPTSQMMIIPQQKPKNTFAMKSTSFVTCVDVHSRFDLIAAGFAKDSFSLFGIP